jgi:hypothetical protein
VSKWVITLLFLVGSMLLTQFIPFSSFFRNLDTLVHEFGHAAATLLLSGEVHYIHLFEDHSGVTLSSVSVGWRVIPVALAGYFIASLSALFLFSAYRQRRLELGLMLITLVALLSLILFIRNAYGVSWVSGFIVVNVLVMLLGGRWIKSFYYLLIAFICLEQSVMGPVSLLVLAIVEPERAGDAALLSSTTGVPAIGWAALFVGFSFVCAKSAIGHFLGRSRKRTLPLSEGADRSG